jgi:FkbM family methyltransferase
VFIDVGTHGGLYSIIAGIRKCRVFSFEPNPINLRYLKENLTLNGLANVVVIPEALSDYNGIFRLYYSATETALSSGVRLDGQEQIDVKCSKLDDVLKLNCIETVDFLKIDTEGCDLKVLKGATDILKITKNLVIEENDAQVRNLLASLGFSFYTLKPSGYLLAKNDNLYKYP